MRERSYPVNTEILKEVAGKNRRVARLLNITPQRWYMYKAGKNDVPESVLEAFCEKFNVPRERLIRAT